MSSERYEYVMAIAEEQNFTRAAKRLYISQPSLTQYINRLEAELGVRLFNRTSSPVTLTPAGTFYLNSMRKIYVAEQRLCNEIKIFQETQRVFTIGMSTLRANMWLPPILGEFCPRHPELSIHCKQAGDTTLEEMVQQGKIDVALGALNPGFADLKYRSFPKETLQWVVPRSYGLVPEEELKHNSPRNPYLISPQMLENKTMLVPEPEYGFYSAAKKVLDMYKIRYSKTLICNNPETNYQLVAKGLGFTVSTAIVLDSIYPQLRDKLAFCTLTDPPVCREGMIAWREGSTNSDLIDEFVELSVRTLNELYPQGT